MEDDYWLYTGEDPYTYQPYAGSSGYDFFAGDTGYGYDPSYDPNLNSYSGGSGSWNWGSTLSNPSLLASLGGGLLSTIKPSQVGTQTSTQAPWVAQQPYLQDLFAKAQGALNTSLDMSGEEDAALMMMGREALMGSPVSGMGQQTYANMLSGFDANPTLGLDNPYLTATIRNAQNDAIDTYNMGTRADLSRAASQAGAFGLGNSAYEELTRRNQQDLGQTLGNISLDARMQDYGRQQSLFEADQNRRMNLATLSPQMAASRFADADKLYQVGQTRRFDPYSTLGKYGSLIQGQYGGVTSSPLYQNKAQDFLGGTLGTMGVLRNAGLLGS